MTLTVTFRCGHTGEVWMPVGSGGFWRAKKHAEATRALCPACQESVRKILHEAEERVAEQAETAQ